MKLLYTVIILGLIQLVVVKPLEASINTTHSSRVAKENLYQFYENNLNLLAKDFNRKAKKFCEKILQDPIIQQAATPLVKEFKRNITDYLHYYAFYSRHGLDKKLLLIFSDIDYYYQKSSDNKDSRYILQLLIKQGYDELCDEYEYKFQKFVKEKFQNKFEEFKAQLSQQELKHHKNLIKWYQKVKECRNYECFYNQFSRIVRLMKTPKQELIDYVRDSLEDIYIYFGNSANDIAKAVLKDQQLSQLSTNLSQQLNQSLNDFITKYEKNKDATELYNLIISFYDNILLKYYYNTTIPNSNDQQLLVKIFKDHGYDNFELNYQKKFNDFVQQGLAEQFEQFKSALSRRELIKERLLLQWFDYMKSLKTYDERAAGFVKLYDLDLGV